MKYSKNKIILADFGASRVKSIVVDCDTKIVYNIKETESPSVHSDLPQPFFAIPAHKYYQAFKDTVLYLLDLHPEVDKIFLCSEMHGFALQSNDEFTPYISWKDNRTNVKDYEYQAEWFLDKTGMKLRSGLPYLNIKSLIDPNKKYKFYTLIDLILEQAGCKNIKTDFSLAASTGLVNIHSKTWSQDLYTFDNIQFNEINTKINQPIAELGNVQIYGGIGDLQAAVLGVDIDDCAIINLGTGSQVICKERQQKFESRPYLDKHIQVITHIPSGRALNVFADFFDSISNSKNFFWNNWNLISTDDVVKAQSNVDLNLFESAWKYKTGGFITFEEGCSNYKTIIANIAKSWLEQYIEALDILDPNCSERLVKLSGGLTHKSKFVIESLNTLDPKRNYISAAHSFTEETLEGLYNLYLKNENSHNRC
jgi:sugar (pentulose or hexulose) kinase